MLGGWLIFILCLFIIGATTVFFVFRPTAPEVSKITVSVEPDSAGVVSPVIMQKIDSMAALVKQQDINIRERYAYMVEQKEQENTLIAIAGVLISIILAIFGFFGYRSFKSIEDKAINNAREKASSKVNTEMVTIRKELDRELRGVINKTFQDEYENNLRQQVEDIINAVYNDVISARLGAIKSSEEELNTIKERLISVETFVSALRDNGITIKFDTSISHKSDLAAFAEERKRNQDSDLPEIPEGGAK